MRQAAIEELAHDQPAQRLGSIHAQFAGMVNGVRRDGNLQMLFEVPSPQFLLGETRVAKPRVVDTVLRKHALLVAGAACAVGVLAR